MQINSMNSQNKTLTTLPNVQAWLQIKTACLQKSLQRCVVLWNTILLGGLAFFYQFEKLFVIGVANSDADIANFNASPLNEVNLI